MQWQTGFFTLDKTTNLREGNSEFKSAILLLEINLMPYPTCGSFLSIDWYIAHFYLENINFTSFSDVYSFMNIHSCLFIFIKKITYLVLIVTIRLKPVS